jgi:homoserine kinase
MTNLIGRRISVKVPATTANLGPGLDTLGLALAIYDDLEVVVREQPGAHVEVHGVGEATAGGQGVETDETNLVVRSMAAVFEAYEMPVPGVDIVARNSIPHGRGLGSSGAAIVAGIMAAKGILDGVVEIDGDALLGFATILEGHPDNVAPALFGGLTIAWTSPTGPKHKKLMVHRGVSPLIAVPESTMSTALARSLQPQSVPHEDAIFNVSRSALLIAALVQSPELLLDATEDRLHQNYRASAMKETDDLIRALRSHGLAAVVSGAGPSVLVLASDPAQRVIAAELVAQSTSSPWSTLSPAVDFKGATVVAHPVEGS